LWVAGLGDKDYNWVGCQQAKETSELFLIVLQFKVKFSYSWLCHEAKARSLMAIDWEGLNFLN